MHILLRHDLNTSSPYGGFLQACLNTHNMLLTPVTPAALMVSRNWLRYCAWAAAGLCAQSSSAVWWRNMPARQQQNQMQYTV